MGQKKGKEEASSDFHHFFPTQALRSCSNVSIVLLVIIVFAIVVLDVDVALVAVLVMQNLLLLSQEVCTVQM